MRIGIRGHDVKPNPSPSIEEMAAEMRAQGFCCTQLALRKAIRDFNTSREAMTPGMAMYLRDVFAKSGVDIAVLGCYLNMADPNEAALDNTLEEYKAHLRFAALLGCGVVGTETGAVNESYAYEPANHTEAALAVFIRNLETVVGWAERFGVIFAIEPVWNHIVCDAKRARKVLDTIQSPNLQIILDPVNLLSAENCADSAAVVEEAFELLGEDIAIIHVKDFVIREGLPVSVPAGDGQLDYPLLMRLIKERKPFIHAVLEDTVPENARQCRAFVERAYAQA